MNLLEFFGIETKASKARKNTEKLFELLYKCDYLDPFAKPIDIKTNRIKVYLFLTRTDLFDTSMHHTNGDTVFHTALKNFGEDLSPNLVQILIDKGFKTTETDGLGRTPYEYAIQENECSADVIRLLSNNSDKPTPTVAPSLKETTDVSKRNKPCATTPSTSNASMRSARKRIDFNQR